MRFKHVMPVGIALLAFTAAPASAQWFVTPYAGAGFGGDAPNTKADVGAGIGWLGGGVLGFEADFNYAPNFFESSNRINFNSKDSNLSTVMLDLMASAPVHAGFRPYGSGGVGWMKSRVNNVDQAFQVRDTDHRLVVPLGRRGSHKLEVRFRPLAGNEFNFAVPRVAASEIQRP